MPPDLPQHILSDVLGISSVAAIVYGVRHHGRGRPCAWYLFAAGQLCFVLGDGGRAYYESVLGVEAPFPSLADVFYLRPTRCSRRGWCC